MRTSATAPAAHTRGRLVPELIAAVQRGAAPWSRGRDDPVLLDRLVEAFIEAEIERLFVERNERMAANEEGFTYERAQARLWGLLAERRAEELARDAGGPLLALEAGEDWSPAAGLFLELQHSRLDRLAAGECSDDLAAEMVAGIGLAWNDDRGPIAGAAERMAV